jgi:hypothetical protein
MIRLSRTMVAAVIAATGVLPRWTPISGAQLLGAQQPPKPHVAASDSSDDVDKDDDSNSENDDDSDNPKQEVQRAGNGERTVDVARMLRLARDTGAPMHVRLAYGAGDLSVMPADGPWLYDVRLNYQPDRESPNIAYDPASRTLAIGGKKTNDDINVVIGDHHGHSSDALHVALARKVPLDLDLTFGAANATAKLGGLSVQSLNIQTGAADAEVSFASPDPVPLQQLDLKIGAASFAAKGLGNAHVQHMTVKGIASDVDLDFGGEWTGDATLDLQAALGSVHIHVPDGVVVDAPGPKMLIGSWDNSAGPATPLPGGKVYHLHIVSKAALGSVDVDRKTRE